MKRRLVLWLTLLATLLPFLPKRRPPDDARLTRAIEFVRARLSHLELDPDGLRRFVEDKLDRSTDDESGIVLSDDLARQFLLSSDFFLHEQDEHRTIQYFAYFDPYERGCGNTIARPGDDVS